MQTRVGSLVESVVNILIGYSINICAQLIIFPLFDITIPLRSNIAIGICFTGISLTRSYVIRRVFNWKNK